MMRCHGKDISSQIMLHARNVLLVTHSHGSARVF